MTDAGDGSGRRYRADDEGPPWWLHADSQPGQDPAGQDAGAAGDDDVPASGGSSVEDGLMDDDAERSGHGKDRDAAPESAGTDGTGASPDSSPDGSDREMVSPSTEPLATQPSRRRRDPFGTTVRGIGQVLITAGVVVLLFVVYELWVTNIFGAHKQAEATEALNDLWAQQSTETVVDPGDSPVVTEPGGTVVVTQPADQTAAPDRNRHYDTTEGAGFAKMYVPAFGADFVLTIIEGTNQADLYAGPGHYLDSQYPGEPGNFALAGHRVNKGAPFDDLGLLDSCDAIVIETVDQWYVYRVLPMDNEVADWGTTKHAHCAGVTVQSGQYEGVYGRDITSPTDIAQIRPVPHVNSLTVPADAESLITLTTCHPKFSDRQRMIIHGILVKSYPKSDGFLPPQLQETS